MPDTRVHEVTCADCGVETTVGVTLWPATRHEPADGQTSPEECPKCGKPFGPEDEWRESEPPEPDPHPDW